MQLLVVLIERIDGAARDVPALTFHAEMEIERIIWMIDHHRTHVCTLHEKPNVIFVKQFSFHDRVVIVNTLFAIPNSQFFIILQVDANI
jgi:hypothetical protein